MTATTTISLQEKKTLKKFQKLKYNLQSYFGKELRNDDVINFMVSKFRFSDKELEVDGIA